MNNASEIEEDPAVAASSSWPLERRLGDSNWRIRSLGFEFVSSQVASVKDDGDMYDRETLQSAVCANSPSLDADGCLLLLANSVGDQNANVMDKALDAFREFLDALGNVVVFSEGCARTGAGSVFHSSADACLKYLTAKCLKASKRTTLVKSAVVCSAMVEMDQGLVVMQALVEGGFGHKVPKAVAAALEAALGIIRGFYGTGEYDSRMMEEEVKTLLNGIARAKLYGHANAAVRTHVKDILVALMGTSKRAEAAVRGILLEVLPDTMKKEVLDGFMSRDGNNTDVEKRYTKRVQKERSERAAAAGPASEYPDDVDMMDVDDAEDDPDVSVSQDDADADPFEFTEPVNVMPSLQKAKVKLDPDEDAVPFWDCFASKKWNVRKAAVEMVKDAVTKAIRLDPQQSGDYASLVREFKRILAKDANIHCAAMAASASESMAKALRNEFSSYAKQLCPDVMGRFKEKNPVMGQSAESCLRTFATYCYSLKDVSDDITEALSHKNPKLRMEVLRYLSFLLERESKREAALCKDSLSAAVKLLEDADGKVRHEAQNALVVFARVMGGLTPIKPFLNGLDEKKKEILERAIKEDRNNSAKSDQPKSLQTNKQPRTPAPEPVAGELRRTKGDTPAKPADKPATKPMHPAKQLHRPGAKIQSSSNECGIGSSNIAVFAENPVSRDSAEEYLVRTFGPELTENLMSSLWQERVAATAEIFHRTSSVLASDDASPLLLSLSHVPSWGDKNFQVLNKLFEIAALAAAESKTGDFGLPHASCIVQGAFEKIHELKHRAQASSALTAACERVGPKYVVSMVHQRAAWHKNPKVLAECIAWIQKTIDDFGYNNIDSKGSIAAWMKDDLSSADPNVRAKALLLLGECHSQVGSGPFESLMEGLKPALATSLKETFSKRPLDSSYQPALTTKLSGSSIGDSGVPSTDDIGEDERFMGSVDDQALDDSPFEPQPVVDRIDVSRLLGESLVAQMMSSNWKERNAAVESVEEIISSSKHVTADIPVEFLGALRKRFSDTNRNLAARSITLAGMLATAVGPEFDKIAHGTLLSAAVENLADSKKQVREAVVGMLDAWGQTCPKDRLFPALADAVSNPKGASEGKTIALKWMVDNYQDNSRCAEISMKAAKAGARDKTQGVRGMAAQLEAVSGGGSSGRAVQVEKKNVAKIRPAQTVASTRNRATIPGTTSQVNRTARTPARRPDQKSAVKRPSVKAQLNTKDVIGIESSGNGGLFLVLGQGKGARSKQYRPRPGGFEPPSPSDRARLQDLLEPIASPSLWSKMFSTTFQDHVEAMNALIESIPSHMGEILMSLDLILGWVVVILCEQNTQSSLKGLEFLKVVLEHLSEDGYRLSDMEASILMPAITEKSGQNQDYLRSAYRGILVLAASVYSPSKVIDFIVVGLGTKNSRSKVECCLAMSEIIAHHGGRFVTSAKQRPVVSLARLVGDRDASLRSAALSALVTVQENVDHSQFELMLSKAEVSDRELVATKLYAAKVKTEPDAMNIQREVLMNSSVEHEQFKLAQGEYVSPLPESLGPDRMAPCRPAPGNDSQVDTIRNSTAPHPTSTPYDLEMTPESTDVPSSKPGVVFTPVSQPVQLADNVDTPVPVELKVTPGESNDLEYDSSGGFPTREVRQAYDAHDFERRWERNIELMYGSNLPDAIDATKRICSDIMLVTSKDSPAPSARTLAFLASTADKFVLAVCAQLEVIFADAARQVAEGCSLSPSPRGCKFALNALLQGLGVDDLALAIPQPTLRTAISLLLCSLVDEHGLLCFEQGATLVRAVNVLIAKMLDATDKNYAFAALLHLLRSPPSKSLVLDSAVPKFNDLVVKCLIKLTKGLESGAKDVDISFLMVCLHDYFMFLGVEEIRKRSAAEDKPLRMVKTILHQICKLVGYNVYQYTTGIPGRHTQPQPIIFRYIDINLKMLKEMNQLPTEELGTGGSTGARLAAPALVRPGLGRQVETHNLLDEEVRVKLKDVLSRVTSRDPYTKSAAMRELLEVKRKHPQMVERYLNATQARFRTYIEDSLKEMANETGGSMAYASPANNTSNVQSVDALAARLARLRSDSK
jgi:cytoskeleton-associated protein 5